MAHSPFSHPNLAARSLPTRAQPLPLFPTARLPRLPPQPTPRSAPLPRPAPHGRHPHAPAHASALAQRTQVARAPRSFSPDPPACCSLRASPTPRVSPDGPVPHASAHARTLSPTRCHAGPARQRPSLPFRPGSAQRPPGITGELAGIPIPPQSPPGLLLTTRAAPLRRHPVPLAPHEP